MTVIEYFSRLPPDRKRSAERLLQLMFRQAADAVDDDGRFSAMELVRDMIDEDGVTITPLTFDEEE
jgi:hypothetical protein